MWLILMMCLASQLWGMELEVNFQKECEYWAHMPVKDFAALIQDQDAQLIWPYNPQEADKSLRRGALDPESFQRFLTQLDGLEKNKRAQVSRKLMPAAAMMAIEHHPPAKDVQEKYLEKYVEVWGVLIQQLASLPFQKRTYTAMAQGVQEDVEKRLRDFSGIQAAPPAKQNLLLEINVYRQGVSALLHVAQEAGIYEKRASPRPTSPNLPPPPVFPGSLHSSKKWFIPLSVLIGGGGAVAGSLGTLLVVKLWAKKQAAAGATAEGQKAPPSSATKSRR